MELALLRRIPDATRATSYALPANMKILHVLDRPTGSVCRVQKISIVQGITKSINAISVLWDGMPLFPATLCTTQNATPALQATCATTGST